MNSYLFLFLSIVENISELSYLQSLLRHDGLFQSNNQDLNGIPFFCDSSLIKYLLVVC